MRQELLKLCDIFSLFLPPSVNFSSLYFGFSKLPISAVSESWGSLQSTQPSGLHFSECQSTPHSCPLHINSVLSPGRDGDYILTSYLSYTCESFTNINLNLKQKFIAVSQLFYFFKLVKS